MAKNGQPGSSAYRKGWGVEEPVIAEMVNRQKRNAGRAAKSIRAAEGAKGGAHILSYSFTVLSRLPVSSF